MTDDFIQFHRPFITEDEVNEVVDTVRSGWWTTGPKSKKFEQEFNSYIGSRRSVAASSWTAAAHLSLEALGIREGDEVIIPAMTFTATAEIVCYFGAKPVIVDVDPDSLNIMPSAIEKAITSRTKAVIPVHYGGMPCDMDEITEICSHRNIKILEDAAHALPAFYKNRRIGTIGDVTCFSFYATKTLATGEGGMICTDDEEIAERCIVMRLHGISRDPWKRYTAEGSWFYEVISPGFKYNFTDIQAALGIQQLKKVDRLWEMRREIAEKYNQHFAGNEMLKLPAEMNDRQSALHLYQIQLNLKKLNIDRSQFIDILKEQGVGTSVHFIPLYRHPYYRERYNLQCSGYPNSEAAYPRLVSLPIWPGMSDRQIESVAEKVTGILRKHKL